MFRKVIKIRAEDSPNVRREVLRQQGAPEGSWPAETPGVVTFEAYQHRRKTWDKVKQSVGLDAEFYEGAEVLLFPPAWLDASHRQAKQRGPWLPQRALGVDPAEGGDKTVWIVADALGVLDLVSLATADTNVIPGKTIELMARWQVDPARVVFDRGGGGKQHADRLKGLGYPVRSVGFGETPALQPKRGLHLLEERKDIKEEHYAYKNLRAQMYWDLRMLLDPGRQDEQGKPVAPFAIPEEYTELRRQLAPLPLWYDEEGRFYLPPKQKRGEDQLPGARETNKVTIDQLVGCSPDEADALVLAIFAIQHKARVPTAGILK